MHCPRVVRLARLCYPIGHGEWRSLVAHLHGVQGVAGSIPVSPTSAVFLSFPSFIVAWLRVFRPDFSNGVDRRSRVP